MSHILSILFYQRDDEDRAEATVNLTSNHTSLTATDISGTVTVLESLLESASTNEEVQAYAHVYVDCNDVYVPSVRYVRISLKQLTTYS